MIPAGPTRGRRSGAAAVALTLSAGLLMGADAPTGGERGVHAFVLTNLWYAHPGGAHSCPVLSDGGVESFYKSLSPEEQAKYATPDRRQALQALMAQRLGFRVTWVRRAKLPPGVSADTPLSPEQVREIAALNGFPKDRGRLAFQNRTIAYSSCTNPEDFPALAKGFRTYDGPVAAGIDLDGKASREDFAGPDGKKGVDNQLWRAIGCVKVFGEQADEMVAKNTTMSLLAPTVIELRGVDDLRNDPEVTVNVYASSDPVARDARGQPLKGASFSVIGERRLQATTRGRIQDGVLTTEPVDLRLNYKEQIIDSPREIRGARLRIEMKPDGAIEGSIFGYYTLASFWDSVEQMTEAGVDANGISCPALRRTVERLADGYKDPRTHRFTAISSAMNFVGVRAFAVKAGERQVAERGS